MNSKQLLDAMGHRDGDLITLSNQWASVYITHERAESGWVYVVSGDVITPEYAANPEFATLAKALACALHSLAEYQRGAYR